MRIHKILQPLKSLAIIWILCILNWTFISNNSVAEIILRYSISWFEPHLKTIGICFYAIVLKEEKKERKRKNDHSKTFIKTHILQKTKHRWQIISVDMLIFETQDIGCDLSSIKVKYNLTRRTTKTEKFEKYLKMYIISFKTKGYELTASGNIIDSILIYKPNRLVSNLRPPKEEKQA